MGVKTYRIYIIHKAVIEACHWLRGNGVVDLKTLLTQSIGHPSKIKQKLFLDGKLFPMSAQRVVQYYVILHTSVLSAQIPAIITLY